MYIYKYTYIYLLSPSVTTLTVHGWLLPSICQELFTQRLRLRVNTAKKGGAPNMLQKVRQFTGFLGTSNFYTSMLFQVTFRCYIISETNFIMWTMTPYSQCWAPKALRDLQISNSKREERQTTKWSQHKPRHRDSIASHDSRVPQGPRKQKEETATPVSVETLFSIRDQDHLQKNIIAFV